MTPHTSRSLIRATADTLSRIQMLEADADECEEESEQLRKDINGEISELRKEIRDGLAGVRNVLITFLLTVAASAISLNIAAWRS